MRKRVDSKVWSAGRGVDGTPLACNTMKRGRGRPSENQALLLSMWEVVGITKLASLPAAALCCALACPVAIISSQRWVGQECRPPSAVPPVVPPPALHARALRPKEVARFQRAPGADVFVGPLQQDQQEIAVVTSHDRSTRGKERCTQVLGPGRCGAQLRAPQLALVVLQVEGTSVAFQKPMRFSSGPYCRAGGSGRQEATESTAQCMAPMPCAGSADHDHSSNRAALASQSSPRFVGWDRPPGSLLALKFQYVLLAAAGGGGMNALWERLHAIPQPS